MSKELIIEKILSDAQQKASEIIATAEQKAEKLVKDAETEAAQTMQRAVSEAKNLVPELLRRKLSVAELEVKKIRLKAKQDVLENVFEQAMQAIRALPKQEYLAFIENMLIAASEDGDIVIVAEADKADVTQAFIDKIAAKKGIKLSIGKAYGSFAGGLMLESKSCTKNMTLELELASLREEREAKIARMIFEE